MRENKVVVSRGNHLDRRIEFRTMRSLSHYYMSCYCHPTKIFFFLCKNHRLSHASPCKIFYRERDEREQGGCFTRQPLVG
jgi:hypothetical protein